MLARRVGYPGHLERLRLFLITTGSCRVHPGVEVSSGPRGRSPGDLQLAASTQAGAEAKHPGREDHGGAPHGKVVPRYVGVQVGAQGAVCAFKMKTDGGFCCQEGNLCKATAARDAGNTGTQDLGRLENRNRLRSRAEATGCKKPSSCEARRLRPSARPPPPGSWH